MVANNIFTSFITDMKIISLCSNGIFPQYKTNLRQYHNIKQSAICFRSRDLLDLPEQDIFNKIKDSIKPENFLGQGTEAEVYKIKDTNYCVKIPYLAEDMYRFNYTKELSPIDKINHVVAKLGFGASIMKYFEGSIPKWYMNNNHERYVFQEQISEMPVKSYSSLLHQIADAIDNEMLFDFSPGNLIVDTKNKKLTAIDFYGISDNPRPLHPLTEMYSVLTCYGSLEKTGKKIFDKIVDAGLEEFKPNKIPCMDVALFDFLEICLKRVGDAYTSGGEKFKSTIMYSADILKKVKKAEITDKTLSPMLSEKLKEFKNLIAKIR